VVVGAEWADRVSPYAGYRPLGQPENECLICNSSDTSCTHATWTTQLAKGSPVNTERTLMARARAQTARTAASSISRGAKPGVSEVQAQTIPEAPPQAPAEGAQSPDPGPVVPPPVAKTEQVLDGDGVLQLSPIQPDVGAQTVATDPTTYMVPAGDPDTFRDVLTEPVPEGKIDAATDPQRPRRDGLQGVLVSRNDLWPQTGAWMTDPTNARRVILTRDVHRVEYPWSTRNPSYMLVGRRGTVLPRPRTV
jgi:hypothetical protein